MLAVLAAMATQDAVGAEDGISPSMAEGAQTGPAVAASEPTAVPDRPAVTEKQRTVTGKQRDAVDRAALAMSDAPPDPVTAPLEADDTGTADTAGAAGAATGSTVEAATPDSAEGFALATELTVVTTGGDGTLFRPFFPEALTRFYAARRYAPAWFEPGSGSPPMVSGKVTALLRVLGDAGRQGLEPNDYHPTLLAARLTGGPADTRALIQADLLLTDAVMGYLSHLGSGRLTPVRISRDMGYETDRPDPIAVATGALAADDIAAYAATFVPRHPLYPVLLAALEHSRQKTQATAYPIPSLPERLEFGMRDPAVAALRARLTAAGLVKAAAPTMPQPDAAGAGVGVGAGARVGVGAAGADADVFDETLRAAVKRFQQQSGVLGDGIVGAQTRSLLNQSAADRHDSLRANLERIRWLPDDLGRRHVFVNIPAFTLTAVEDGLVAAEMAVVVGRDSRRTPMLRSTMADLVFNPTWTVPVKLAREDILPRVIKDPSYLANHNMRIYSGWDRGATELDPTRINWEQLGGAIGNYRLRQEPGPHNALGHVKFRFPSAYGVYLHDTPDQKYFRRAMRAFSSGCVRVSDPNRLTSFVLSGMDAWPPERRAKVISGGTTTAIPLAHPPAVHLFYLTVRQDAHGALQFLPDLYGWDAMVARALRQPPQARPRAGQRLAQAQLGP